MDQATLDTIRELAKTNGIDPDELLAAVDSGDLPDELKDAIAVALGDLSLFGQALDNLDD